MALGYQRWRIERIMSDQMCVSAQIDSTFQVDRQGHIASDSVSSSIIAPIRVMSSQPVLLIMVAGAQKVGLQSCRLRSIADILRVSISLLSYRRTISRPHEFLHRIQVACLLSNITKHIHQSRLGIMSRHQHRKLNPGHLQSIMTQRLTCSRCLTVPHLLRD